MLNLTRTEDEKIIITVPPGAVAQRVEIVIGEIRRGQVKLGITAERSVTIHQAEVQEDVDANGARRQGSRT